MKRTVIALMAGSAVYVVGLIVMVLSLAGRLSFPLPVEEHYSIGREVNAFIGLIVLCLGSGLLLYVEEKALGTDGGSKAWLLSAFLGPVAMLVLVPKTTRRRLRQAETSRGALFLASSPVSVPNRIVGATFTCFVVLFFACLTYQLIAPGVWPKALVARRMRRNENLAFKRLRTIAEAQEEYRNKDWDGDGQKSYALYLVHLWVSVDRNAYPVRADLIPRRLAFAMRRCFAIDGYFYTDIHYFPRPAKNGAERSSGKRERENADEFAVAAFPAEYGKTGKLSFIVDSTGTVIARALEKIPPDSDVGLFVYPHRPTDAGWILIKDPEELIDLQKALFD